MSQIGSNGQEPMHGAGARPGSNAPPDKVVVGQRLSNPLGLRSPFQLSNRGIAGPMGRANGNALRSLAGSGSVGTGLGQPPVRHKWARWCAVLLVVVYFIRGTVLPRILPVPSAAWIPITVLGLSLAVGIAMAGGVICRWSWVVVLLAFFAGISQADRLMSAGLRWVGLVLLILSMGPVIVNPVAIEMRSAAWRLVTKGLTALTLISLVWYALHLPCPAGRVPFAGFMNQSMLLGPVAGMGVVIGLARAVHGRSRRWGLLAVLGVIPLVASGSRLALLAAGAGGCFCLIRRKPVLGGVLTLGFVAAVCAFIAQGGANQLAREGLLAGLSKKGLTNSRATRWQARLEEFESSPLIGIGIAMATEAGVGGEDENGDVHVEPGSSYLALLANTGALGTTAFFSVAGLLIFGFAFARGKTALDKDILSAVGIFLGVHGIAEGWVLGFGSPLCFLFWLWLGSVGDAVLQPVGIGTRPGMVPTRTPGPRLRLPWPGRAPARSIPSAVYGPQSPARAPNPPELGSGGPSSVARSP